MKYVVEQKQGDYVVLDTISGRVIGRFVDWTAARKYAADLNAKVVTK